MADDLNKMGKKMTFFIENQGALPFLHFVRLINELGNEVERVVFVGSGTGFHENGLAVVARQKGLKVFVVDPDPLSFSRHGEQVLLEPTHADIEELPRWERGTILVMFWPNPTSVMTPHTWDAEALKFPHDASLVFFARDGTSGSKDLLSELDGEGEYSVPLRSCHTLFVGTGKGMAGTTLVLQSHLAGFEGEAEKPEPKHVPMPKGELIEILHRTLTTLAVLDEPEAFSQVLVEAGNIMHDLDLLPAET